MKWWTTTLRCARRSGVRSAWKATRSSSRRTGWRRYLVKPFALSELFARLPTTTAPGGGEPNAAAFQAYRACLSAQGITLPAGQPPASTPGTPGAGAGPQGRFGQLTAKLRQAMAACQSKRPAGARGFGGGGANGGQANGALTKYTACLKSHGVTFGSTSPSSSAFAKATAPCKSLLPASTGGSVNGGTATP